MLLKWSLIVFVGLAAIPCWGQSQVLEAGLRHLRIEGPREWTEFPETASADRLRIVFRAKANEQPQTLRLRQQDVKQNWVVRLNDKELGRLSRDENDMILYLPIPSRTLVAGDNELVIEQTVDARSGPDDIRVGEITIHPRSRDEVLSEATITVTVTDTDHDRPSPARITILDHSGALQTVQTPERATVAVRSGTIYTADGHAQCTLPAGRYTVYAGRGFEFSLASEEVQLRPGQTRDIALAIRRQVPTEGYVACDTHIHTLTDSGHGDATVQERMVTIAGEGIELAVATDHNVQIDHDAVARHVGVRQFFTPVVGNEVTTPVGHFNIFPVAADAAPPQPWLRQWPEIFDEIERAVAPPVIILNHARDLHSGFRPFGPQNFNDAVAKMLNGWPLRFNAMEVINSGATQTDPLRLFQDWMTLLNRGASVTPIGSSDSHDVLRHFVGQGRTYIRCDDRDPAAIDVDEAVESVRQGRVMVSYGLLAEMHVNGRGSGELATVQGQTLPIDLRVLGPHWVTADGVELFVNGRSVLRQNINDVQSQLPDGVKWQGQLALPKPNHDVHLVAIARGPGIGQPYWKTAKPYQPMSPHWQPQIIGCSGAVWIDADGDGVRSSARDYALRLWQASQGDLSRLLASLEGYDESVAAQAAELFQQAGHSLTAEATQTALRGAAPAARAGFSQYHRAWRDSQLLGTAPQ